MISCIISQVEDDGSLSKIRHGETFEDHMRLFDGLWTDNLSEAWDLLYFGFGPFLAQECDMLVLFLWFSYV